MIKAREIVIVFIIIRGLFHFIVTIFRELRVKAPVPDSWQKAKFLTDTQRNYIMNPGNNKCHPFILEITCIFIMLFLFSTSFMIDEGRAEDVRKYSNPSSSKLVMNNKINFPVFSFSKHELERGLVKMKEHVRDRDLGYRGKIYIALEDLKDDGSKIIFSYIDAPYWCGQIGCPLNIYQLHNRKLTSLLPSGTAEGGFPLSITIGQTGNQDVLGILDNKTNGWHDIVLHGQTIWKWNGKNYERECVTIECH